MPPVALRPRTVTELIDASVQLMRRHYLELVTTAAIFTIPLIVLRMFVVPVMPPGQLPSADQLEPLGSIVLVSFVLQSMSSAASVVIVSDSYLGRDVTIGAAITRVVGRFGNVLLAALLTGFLVGFGFVFFLVPGFIFLAWFFATENVVMIEGKSAISSMGRPRTRPRVRRPHPGRTAAVDRDRAHHSGVIAALLGGGVRPLARQLHSAAVVSSIIGICVFPFFTVVVTLLYYDLRIRKEGFDLEIMANELARGSRDRASLETKARSQNGRDQGSGVRDQNSRQRRAGDRPRRLASVVTPDPWPLTPSGPPHGSPDLRHEEECGHAQGAPVLFGARVRVHFVDLDERAAAPR